MGTHKEMKVQSLLGEIWDDGSLEEVNLLLCSFLFLSFSVKLET